MADAPIVTEMLVRTAEEIDNLDWVVLDGTHGVEHKILWQQGGSVAGLMRLGPEAWMAPHVHHRGHHHVWLVEGEAAYGDHVLEAGSYVHVPVGVEHGLEAGPNGCQIFYLYLR